jgi:hypothetical protein
MKEETKTESPKYTTVIHSVRIALDLSLNEYCLADIIYNLSNNPSSRFPGWCYASKETLSKFLGVTSRTVFEMIERLISKDLIQKEDDTKWLKTTSKWYDLVVLEKLKIKPNTYEETAQPMKKVHSTYEETSHLDYEETSYDKDNSYNDINKVIINSETSSQPMEYFVQHKPIRKSSCQETFLSGNVPDINNTDFNNNTDINNNIYSKQSLPDKNLKIIEKKQPENQKNPINMVLDEFFNINPTLNYGNNTQRKAAQDLINMFGLNQLILMIRWYATQTSNPFCPVATTPLTFKNKISEIKIYADKLKTSKNQVSKIERTLSDGTIAIKKYGVWVMKSDPNVKIDLKYFPELQDFSPKNNNPKIIEVETS